MLLRGYQPRTAAGFFVYCYVNKKGKKKKSAAENKRRAANSAAQKDERSPARIVDTSQLSLKTQLRFVRSIKRVSGAATPVYRSKFRRKKEDNSPQSSEAQSPAVMEELSSLAEEERMLTKGKGLTSLYNSQGTMNPPAVLVDGYNVLARWLCEPGEKARKDRVRDSLEFSRLEILRDLSDYSGWRKFRMMVAFDAQGNPDAPTLARDQVGGVEVVYVGDGEADSFIISEARQLRKAGCPYVLVASSDNDVRDATWFDEIIPVSATQLLMEIKKVILSITRGVPKFVVWEPQN